MNQFAIISVIIFVFWLFVIWYRYKLYLHILQLEDYEPKRLLKMVWREYKTPSKKWATALPLLPAGAMLTGSSLYTGLGFWIIACLFLIYKLRSDIRKSKKPLVMTKRATSIFWLSLFIGTLIPAIAYYLTPLDGNIDGFVISMIATSELGFFVLSGAVLILHPSEQRKQRFFINDAKRILNDIKPLVIGITGSYGKTGTKEILTAMLAEKYNVYRPPGSYNTLMGVTRAIREGLRPQHEAFVVEMGAYRIGSIEKLCNLVNPTHGLITIIGVQHLERFGSQKAIQQAKGELIRSLPTDGIAVLNGDDPLCREIGSEFGGKVVYFTVIANEMKQSPSSGDSKRLLRHFVPHNDSSISVQNIKIATDGSDFDIRFPDGETLPAHLSLLGRSAISNAVAAAAMADQLGVKRRSIVRAMSTIPHVRHRLEPIKREGGITVIDDAFNSNPIGAAGALEVLAMADGRRILVTPGMIELGEIEEHENREFGRKAATACDLAVLIGNRRVEPIKQGLIEGGFDGKNIWVESSLNDALERLKRYLKAGDTMLFENDLPDQYNDM